MRTGSYTFYADAGHAWLEVTRKEIDILGIGEKISACSYQKKNGLCYLEEDCDAGIFINALAERGRVLNPKLDINEHYSEDNAVIRDFDRYYPTPPVITANIMQELITPEETPFNLIQEEQEDGARVQSDKDKAQERKEANEKAQLVLF